MRGILGTFFQGGSVIFFSTHTRGFQYRKKIHPAGEIFNVFNFPCRVDMNPGSRWRYQGVLHFIGFKKKNAVITSGEIIAKIKVKP